jgi:hypothetical protein
VPNSSQNLSPFSFTKIPPSPLKISGAKIFFLLNGSLGSTNPVG